MTDGLIEAGTGKATSDNASLDPATQHGLQPSTEKWLAFAAPYLFGILFLGGWEATVRIEKIRPICCRGRY